jgi:hypothetical protein
LSSIRKAISNFVRILTRQPIPVYFNDTDTNCNFGGKTIYISAKISTKHDFDVAVGQALHEGAHTLKTDFDSVKLAWTNIPHEIWKISDAKNIRRASMEKFIHNMWNVIEDRYIDNYVFQSAPGYRGYYVALYDAFWHNPDIDEALTSDLYRYPSIESYDFRITNLTNQYTDLTALPRLDEIAKIINISEIGRLKNTEDRINVAFEVVKVVLDCLEKDMPQQKSSSPGGKQLAKASDFFDFGENENLANDPADNGKGDEKTEDPAEDDYGKKMVDEISDVMSGRDDKPEELKENKDTVTKISDGELSPETKKKIKKITEGQRKFLQGEFPKETVTEAQKELLDLIEKHDIVLVRVAVPTLSSGDDKNLKIDCIVVRKMTKELIFAGTDVFPLCGIMKFGDDLPTPNVEVADAVKKGIILGTKLGRKLQIRNEVNLNKVLRRKSGKIHRRQIHEAAFDAEDLFYKINIAKHNVATLHISVDASSSMQGAKWYRTMTAVVAICKATSMIDNIHVTVSFRATQMSSTQCLPYVILAYDSKVDKFSKVRNLFPFLSPNGATPEGLAFSAIMGLFENMTPDEEDRYFMNLSDGEPCFRLMTTHGVPISYEGETGVIHTKSQVDKIRGKQVNILSYFIENDHATIQPLSIGGVNTGVLPQTTETTLQKNFKRMYGKDAKFLNVNSVVDLAKSINELFLKTINQRSN